MANAESPIPTFFTRIDALCSEHADDALFVRHLRSTEAIVREEQLRTTLIQDKEAAEKEMNGLVADMLKGLDGTASDPRSYRHGRSLVIAFASKQDGSVQHYLLRLPIGWDPDKTYPAIVDLHGAGPANPLTYPMFGFGPMDPKTFDEGPKDALDSTVVIGPWGRGNRWYRGYAEGDVFEALDDAGKIVKIDPDRIGLMGHSMGGGGAWGLAAKYPDRWSAVCVQSGLDLNAPVGSPMVKNLRYLPFRFWVGSEDQLITQARSMHKAVEDLGGKSELVIANGVGHNVPSEEGNKNQQWLTQFVRKRPETFEYQGERLGRNPLRGMNEPTGAWGVTVVPDFTAKEPFWLKVSTKGQKVAIETRNAYGFVAQLGEGGLGLKGDVEATWNGKRVYKGPAKEISQVPEGWRR